MIYLLIRILSSVLEVLVKFYLFDETIVDDKNDRR